MFLDMAIAAVLLFLRNIQFRRFEPEMPLWRRIAKAAIAIAVTGLISHYFGRTGVLIAACIALLPVVYIHAIWLPRHGVNGWTGEPRETYLVLRAGKRR